MSRSGWFVAVLATTTTVAAEPKPTVVDIKPRRDHVLVLRDDTRGATYVVDTDDLEVWYGTGKTLYAQLQITWSRERNEKWTISLWSPHLDIAVARYAEINKRADGYSRYCGDDREKAALTALSAAEARTALDKLTFMTPAATRSAELLARDSSGTYYYVDVIRDIYGGKGQRVFIGKKGAMKQVPLKDLSSDVTGVVYATKRGELRYTASNATDRSSVVWAIGKKVTPLSVLDLEENARVIYRDLGVYDFLGTPCDYL